MAKAVAAANSGPGPSLTLTLTHDLEVAKLSPPRSPPPATSLHGVFAAVGGGGGDGAGEVFELERLGEGMSRD